VARSRRHHRTITSQDVADYAGVSRATVSAVVNQSRYVSQDLIERVEEAIRVLGYRPNILARGLKIQRTNTIGLVIPNVLSPVWALITRAVEVRARELGFNTIVCDTDEDLDTEKECLSLLIIKQVDGIIIAPCSVASEDYLRSLLPEKPLVFIDRQPRNLPVDCVRMDNLRGAYEATMHLIHEGAQRIALVANMIVGEEPYLDTEWLGGYKQALRDRGLPIDEQLIRVGRRGGYSEPDGYQNTRELLQLPTPPDAILACTHFTTMGVLRAVRELEKSIPEEVALVGYEEVIYNEYINPPLSVVSQPWGQVGSTAVDRLVQRIHSETELAPESFILPATLVVRHSSIRSGTY
jgi:LacI family transcriptional regulator